MTQRSQISLIAAAILLCACGARSARTGGRHDGGAPAVDGARDSARDWYKLDLPFLPRDLYPARDSCLPIPAKEVKGEYGGAWKGIWSCPGQSGVPVSGDLRFSLIPAGAPESFQVTGKMSGVVEPMVPFNSAITGSMGCTSLGAKLPEIIVGSGGIIYRLVGSMQGLYEPLPSTHPPGFSNGSWSAAEKNGSCGAKGSWYAYRQ